MGLVCLSTLNVVYLKVIRLLKGSHLLMAKTIDWVVFTEKADQARHFEKLLQEHHVLDGDIQVVHARGRLWDFAKPDVQNKPRYGREIKKANNSPFSVSNDKTYLSDAQRLQRMPVLLNTRRDGNMIQETVDSDADYLNVEITKALRKAKHVIVATDWDIEGELLFHDVVTNNSLENELDWDQVYRIKLLSLADDDLLDALANKQAYGSVLGENIPAIEQFIAQGFARSIVDYEFGYTFSFYNEVLKRQLGLQFKGGVGRLKLAILDMILNQENNVQSQDLRSSYQITAQLATNPVVNVKLKEGLFKDRLTAENMIGKLPKTVTVRSYHGYQKQLPPQLFTRTELIIHMDELDDHLQWDEPLQTSYEIYRSVSYPRTNYPYVNLTQFNQLLNLLDTDNVQTLLQNRLKSRGYEHINFDKRLPRRKFVADKDTEKEDAAHHAIIPVAGLSEDQLNVMRRSQQKRVAEVYLEILYRTMAMFMADAVDEGQLIKLYNGHDCLGEVLLQRSKALGWRTLIDGETHDDEFVSSDALHKQMSVSYDILEEVPTKLQLFTHAELLKALEQANIGTESTREPMIHMLVVNRFLTINDDDRYEVTDVIKKILHVFRTEHWYDRKWFEDWNEELNQIKHMADGLKFIQAKRQTLQEINKQVIKWYDSKTV